MKRLLDIPMTNLMVWGLQKKVTISIVNNFKIIDRRQLKQKRLERVNFDQYFTNTLSFKEPLIVGGSRDPNKATT